MTRYFFLLLLFIQSCSTNNSAKIQQVDQDILLQAAMLIKEHSAYHCSSSKYYSNTYTPAKTYSLKVTPTASNTVIEAFSGILSKYLITTSNSATLDGVIYTDIDFLRLCKGFTVKHKRGFVRYYLSVSSKNHDGGELHFYNADGNLTQIKSLFRISPN